MVICAGMPLLDTHSLISFYLFHRKFSQPHSCSRRCVSWHWRICHMDASQCLDTCGLWSAVHTDSTTACRDSIYSFIHNATEAAHITLQTYKIKHKVKTHRTTLAQCTAAGHVQARPYGVQLSAQPSIPVPRQPLPVCLQFHHQTTSSLCQPRSSRRALPSSQQLWSAGISCSRPCDMELVIRQSERSGHQQRLYQAFTEDVFIFSLLMYIAHYSFLDDALYKFTHLPLADYSHRTCSHVLCCGPRLVWGNRSFAAASPRA